MPADEGDDACSARSTTEGTLKPTKPVTQGPKTTIKAGGKARKTAKRGTSGDTVVKPLYRGPWGDHDKDGGSGEPSYRQQKLRVLGSKS